MNPDATRIFDENKIVLSFAALSDLHVGNGKAKRDSSYLTKALSLLMDYAGNLDAIIGVGDMTDTYRKEAMEKYPEIETLKTLYENSAAKEVPFIYVMGNHDHDYQRNGGSGVDLTTFIEKMGNQALHTKYDVPCTDTANGSRHAVIGGYHFLFVEPETSACENGDASGAKYKAETKAWLDETLAKITSASPERYVFVMTHVMAYDTAYGSDLVIGGTYWYSKEINEILKKYPQVVIFGGHLHFPLNDPRSIMQTDFTALGCGSVNYMAIEASGYENMASKTSMRDCNEFSQGLLLQIDETGNVKITKMDFYHEATIGNAWMLSHPTADKAHLTAYGKSRGNKGINMAPVLSTMDVEFGGLDENGSREVIAHFAAAKDDEFAHHYELVLMDKTEEKPLKTWKILSDFYRYPNPADMKPMFTQALGNLPCGVPYALHLTAYDSWNAQSETLICDFTCAE